MHCYSLSVFSSADERVACAIIPFGKANNRKDFVIFDFVIGFPMLRFIMIFDVDYTVSGFTVFSANEKPFSACAGITKIIES